VKYLAMDKHSDDIKIAPIGLMWLGNRFNSGMSLSTLKNRKSADLCGLRASLYVLSLCTRCVLEGEPY